MVARRGPALEDRPPAARSGRRRQSGASTIGWRLRARSVAALAAVALSAAACSSGGAHAASPRSALAPVASVNAATRLSLAQAQGVGKVLVDAQGMTLYLFVLDHASKPKCVTSLCLAEWPPLFLAPGAPLPKAGPGVHANLIGSVTQPNGTRQVTYNGWPLYLWAGDTAPGEAYGEGISNFGGPWFAVTANGTPDKARVGL